MKRIVLLGASNLTAGLPIITLLATARWGPGPYAVLAAAGHGRAYGLPSRVLARSLPAIAASGLWSELARQPRLPTRAVVADAGNDLAYGGTVAGTAAAVGRCLERLRQAASVAETILLLPPLTAIARLSPTRFVLLRTLLFPGRRFRLDAILRRLRELDGALRRLAAEHGAQTAELEPRWIAGDGIHIRWRQRRSAWTSLLAGWGPPQVPAGLPEPVRWRFLAAERGRLLGRPLHHPQPAHRLADGSTVSYF